jgi:hypothetical protein
MKIKKALVIILAITMAFTFGACGSAQTTNDEGNETTVTPNEKHAIAYPEGIDIYETGASSYDSYGDHFDSPYFAHPDIYNMESTDTLTVIPNFETYQQTTEYSCGAASALMVLNHYDIQDYDEMEIADMAGVSEETGVGPDGIAGFFKEIGWTVKSSLDFEGDYTFEDTTDFQSWLVENLSAGTPIMVDWIDWSGHWQVIIGYDTMGTDDNFGDDVLILADAYDTSDQYQDGYYIFPAERFFYMWEEGSCTGEEPAPQPWVIATPAE